MAGRTADALTSARHSSRRAQGMVFPDVSAAVLATTAAGVVALLVVIEAAKLIRARRNRVSWERAKTLLTTAEGDVLRRLESAVAGRAVIFAKVWIGDLVQPPSGPQPEEREWSRLHLPRHRVDFVLCSPEDYGIIGVVVLDTGGTAPEETASGSGLGAFVPRGRPAGSAGRLARPASPGSAERTDRHPPVRRTVRLRGTARADPGAVARLA